MKWDRQKTTWVLVAEIVRAVAFQRWPLLVGYRQGISGWQADDQWSAGGGSRPSTVFWYVLLLQLTCLLLTSAKTCQITKYSWQAIQCIPRNHYYLVADRDISCRHVEYVANLGWREWKQSKTVKVAEASNKIAYVPLIGRPDASLLHLRYMQRKSR